MVIDLGLSIDTRSLPPHARFVGGRAASGYACPAMCKQQEEEEEVGKRGWREDADLFAAGASAYCLLHGGAPPLTLWEDLYGGGGGGGGGGGKGKKKKKKKAGGGGSNVWRLKRYWEQEVWTRVFTALCCPDTHLLTTAQAIARLDECVGLLEGALAGPKGKGLPPLLDAIEREIGPFLAGMRAGRV